jgi:hypothetical protein
VGVGGLFAIQIVREGPLEARFEGKMIGTMGSEVRDMGGENFLFGLWRSL